MIGQKSEYWTSKVVNEASPAYYFLYFSPALFIAGSFVWFVSWYFIFNKLKAPIDIFLAILFIAGHSWGSASWIWNIAKINGFYEISNQISVMAIWGFVILYFAIIAYIATYCIMVYFKKK